MSGPQNNAPLKAHEPEGGAPPPPLPKEQSVSGMRVLLPLVAAGRFVIYILGSRTSDPQSLLGSSVLAQKISEGIRSAVPLVPMEFWYFVALAFCWYLVGLFIDRSGPERFDRRTRLPARFWIILAAFFIADLYNLFFDYDMRQKLEAQKLNFPVITEMPALPRGYRYIFPITEFAYLGFLAALWSIAYFHSARSNLKASEVKLWYQRNTRPSFTIARVSQLRTSVRRSHLILSVIIAWVLIAILIQDNTAFSKAVILIGLMVYLSRFLLPKVAESYWEIFGGLFLVFVLFKAGSYHLVLDLFLLVLGFMIARVYVGFVSVKRQLARAMVLVVCTWCLWSLGDALSTYTPSPLHPERFAAERRSSLIPTKRIGVALSGGGYRAAVLHAGILAALEELRMTPTNISSVSGGSITGAYYAAGGAPQDFLDTVIRHKFDLFRDLIDLQNLSRMALSAELPGTHVRLLPLQYFTRTDLQARALDRTLLRNRTLNDIPEAAPLLMICTTDLNSGRAVGVSSNWTLTRFLLRPPGEELFPNAVGLYSGRERTSVSSTFLHLDTGAEKLSKLVAASGAFPLAFAPVRLGPAKQTDYFLADGGVTDNSGMTLLLDADWRASMSFPEKGDPRWSLDLAISADGGSMFTQRATASEEAMPRAMDIIASRIGVRVPVESRGPAPGSRPPMVLLSPSLYVDNSQAGYDFSKLGFFTQSGETEERLRFVNSSGKSIDRQQQWIVTAVTRQLSLLDDSSLPVLEQIADSVYQEGKSTDDSYEKMVGLALDYSWATGAKSGAKAREHPARPLEAIAFAVFFASSDFSQCLQTFLSTPTLEDHLEEKQARQLYRLGQYLVLFNAPALRSSLQPASAMPEPFLHKSERSVLEAEMDLRALPPLTQSPPSVVKEKHSAP